jgi:ABC-type Zn uptake system ZnuABC Zn-binding protein ZnuA
MFRRFVVSTLVAHAAVLGAHAQHTVVATTPDLASLCQRIGGRHVDVVALVKGPQDPHTIEARPSMLLALRNATMLVEVGRELEVGWIGVLVDNARNGAVLTGQPGRIDASAVVRALGLPPAGTDRRDGDVHAMGNPHYLLDPLCGLQVAALLRDRMAAVWPSDAEAVRANYARFRAELAVAMVGEVVATRYDHDAERLALAFGAGKLLDVLREHGDLEKLGGWFATIAPWRGSKLVADHDLWAYVAERFGCEIAVTLEPKPGVPPSTAHLQQVIDRVRGQDIRVIVVAPYFPRQHADVVAKATGATIAGMVHQAGALPGTEDYIAAVTHNVNALAVALAAGRQAK